MKLKLKVSKDIKRSLKTKAVALELTRNEYVLQCIGEILKKNAAVWENNLETFKETYTSRINGLESLINSQTFEEEKTQAEKQNALQMYQRENDIYRYIRSKKGQQENIILPIDEDNFYALIMLADLDKLSVENYVEKMLQYYK